MLKFDLTRPFPKSHDGKEAIRCDAMGRETPMGKHIRWTVLRQGTTEPEVQVAKLFRPEIIERVNWSEVEKETKSRPERFDHRLPKVRNMMINRIKRAFAKFGARQHDALGMVKISRETQMASWCHGTHPDEEYLLIHPWFLRQKMQWVYWTVMQQNTSRALCRGRDHLTDEKLRNLVADICSNRILASTTTGRLSKSWNKFVQWIYPQESKETVLALCNSSLDDYEQKRLAKINPKLAQIWHKLYKTEKGHISLGMYTTKNGQRRERKQKVDGKLSFEFAGMNPDDLYFEIRNALTWEDNAAMQPISQGGMNPFGDSGWTAHLDRNTQTYLRTGVSRTAPAIAKRLEVAMRKHLVPRRFRSMLNWRDPLASTASTKYWDAWIIDPESVDNTSLEEYARRIQTRKAIHSVTGTICRAYANDTRRDPYPHILTEEGQQLVAMGLDYPVFPFYLNAEGTNSKRRLVAFFDLSPSMESFVPYMCDMCRTVEEVMEVKFARNDAGDSGTIGFAESIMEMSDEEFGKMKDGEVAMGCGTSYDDLVEYCLYQIATEHVDAIICFTDGESDLNADNIRLFNKSGKRMYRVYFRQWSAGMNMEQGVIASPLDNLNGESWTLTLPPTDKI